jgi:hypothetical protein
MGALALIALVGSVVVDGVRTAETASPASTGAASSSPNGTPSPSPTPNPQPSLETMELRVAGVAQGTPPGWRRWRATDRSLSFVAPVPDEPVEASFDGDLWEVTIEGSLMDFYIYASDTYLDVGSDALPQLHEIADGVLAGRDELRRSLLHRDGLDGIEMVYEDGSSGYVYVNRLFAADGRFFQLSAAYYRGLTSSSVGRQVQAFFDSIRIRDPGLVPTPS